MRKGCQGNVELSLSLTAPRCPGLSEVAVSEKGPRELGLRGEVPQTANTHGLDSNTADQCSLTLQLQVPVWIVHYKDSIG
jgi:hypothetical protein